MVVNAISFHSRTTASLVIGVGFAGTRVVRAARAELDVISKIEQTINAQISPLVFSKLVFMGTGLLFI
jgi:hypothetical protein